MIAPVPQSGADERRPLLGSNSDDHDVHYKNRSCWYRARRAPVAVACVVAMALFTDMVVYGVVVPILPIIVKERLGGSSSDVGLLFACYGKLVLVIPLLSFLPSWSGITFSPRHYRCLDVQKRTCPCAHVLSLHRCVALPGFA
ncbi:hypothetical protein EDD21DRAFT_68972 [Dissophora ornata]|nr:hypothetical protein EDD21DRAFT_68972 [Dissophora ornata]